MAGVLTPPTADIAHSFTASMYTRLSAAVRLVACFAALHVFFFFDPERQHPEAALRTLLTLLFAIYAAWLYWRTVHDKTSQEGRIVYWIDALWYLAISAMTGGPGSHFFFFLSFPMLFVSLRWGFRPGMAMTIFVSGMLWASGILRSGTGAALLNVEVFLPPIGLLLLGYLMAMWANSDLAVNRRLLALKGFNALFSPRFNIEQMIDHVVRHLATLHPVNKFVLVLLEADRPPKVFRADLPEAMYQVSDAVAAGIQSVVSELDVNGTVIYSGKSRLRSAEIYSSNSNPATQKSQMTHASLIADRLQCAGFGCLQFPLRQGGSARLIVWSDKHPFESVDLPFLHQLSEQLAPRIENVQLLDRLAGEIADAERQKISRDIHDSAIQPYIGLKFGLEALARKIPPESPISSDIGRLVEMATSEITELRTFVKGLRGEEDPGRAALVPALRRQAARFSELYGIAVAVESPGELRIGDALANEAFHIVSEALSNVRRHTSARSACIKLACDHQLFTLRISNPCGPGTAGKLFTPHSIAERTLALGGACRVTTETDGDTEVTVEIPLRGP